MMNTTDQFHSWHVTGLKRLVEIYNDLYTRAAILADGTGLGKTV